MRNSNNVLVSSYKVSLGLSGLFLIRNYPLLSAVHCRPGLGKLGGEGQVLILLF